MKISKVLHVVSVMAGLLGIIALIGAWCASKQGLILGMDETHLFRDATVLVLIAIWLQLGTMHHIKLEEKNERI
jgi:hypothetical protein